MAEQLQEWKTVFVFRVRGLVYILLSCYVFSVSGIEVNFLGEEASNKGFRPVFLHLDNLKMVGWVILGVEVHIWTWDDDDDDIIIVGLS